MKLFYIIFLLLTLFFSSAYSQQQMERLGRGMVAMNIGNNQIYIGWRLLGSDPEDITFNLYQSVNGSVFNKVNTMPVKITTDTVLSGCNLTVSNAFYVKPIINGIEQAASEIFTLAANTPQRQYVTNIPLQNLNDATINTSTAMPGDVDGDGEYELVVMRVGAGGDTARMLLECYKLDGSYLWRFEFGKNINQSNEHNAQAYYVVYDFDGNGKAEVCVRGSERSVFQAGTLKERMVGDVLYKDGITLYPLTASLQRPSAPEYLFMLEGSSGKPLDSIRYQPAMGPAGSYNTTWGGNERPYYQWMSVAYLDGKHPSIVTQRGIGEGYWFKIYGFDYQNGKFSMRNDSLVTQEPITFGGHSIRIKDIDNDGKDEILFTGTAVDHDMKLIYNQEHKGIGHGDGYQILDIDPDRPGLEWFAIQQNTLNLVGAYYWDAATGDILKKYYMVNPTDPSRGDAACLAPSIRGAQMYGGTPGVMDSKGNYVNRVSFSPTGTVYWDADLAKELLQNDNAYRDASIKKYDPITGNSNMLVNLKADGILNTSNFHGATCEGDILGDWREEVVAQTADKLNLRIYTSTTPAQSRYYTLMHNPSYRTQLTCLGRTGGNYPDFYFGPGMTAMPPSPYSGQDMTWSGSETRWDIGTTQSWFDTTGNIAFVNSKKVLFDDFGITGTVINRNIDIAEVVTPATITIAAAVDYVFSGNGGISGDCNLVKTRKGTVTFSNNNLFTGITKIWDGSLNINGTYSSPTEVYGGTWGGYLCNGLTGGRVCGSGKLLQGLTLNEKGGLCPGNAGADIDTIFIENKLILKKRAYIAFDLNANPTGLNDFINVNGAVYFEDTVYFVVNRKGNTLGEGTYRLISFTGTFSGDIGKIILTGIDDQACTLELTSSSINIVVLPLRASQKITWGGISNKWELSTVQNWLYGSNPVSFVTKDSVLFNEVGNAQPLVNIAGQLTVGQIEVNSQSDYTLSGYGSINGPCNLLKSGTGKLTILTNNAFTGKVTVLGGSIEIRSGVLSGIEGPLGMAPDNPSNLEFNNSKLIIVPPYASGFDRGITLTGADTIYTSQSVSMNGLITGTGSLVKIGPGKLNIAQSNTYSGGTIIKEGILSTSQNGNPLGTGTITFAGGILNLADNDGNTETFSTPILVPAGVTATINLDSRFIFSSTLTGAGTLNIMSPYVRADLKGNWSAFSGNINVTTDADGGDFRITNSYGYSNSAVTLGTKVNAYPNGSYTVSFGSLASTATDAKVTTPFTVGAKNTDASFAGIIQGTSSVTKVGAGSWTLSGANTYTGTTNINGGTIIVSNTTGSATGTGSIAVNSTGKISGTGIISGQVNINSGGTMAAGNVFGSLTVNNNVIFNTGAKLAVDVNSSSNFSDKLVVSGAYKIQLKGTLEINDVNGDKYANGNVFTILNCANITGSFSAIVPATPGAGLVWDTTSLRTSGILKVITDPNTVVPLINNNKEITLYPNPTMGLVNLQFENEIKSLRVKIINNTGLVIRTLNEKKVKQTDIDLSDLPQGIYLLLVETDNTITERKIMKQ